MPKNLLILKFLYGRDRPSGLLASKELPGAEQKLPGQDKFLPALPRPPAGPDAVETLRKYVRLLGSSLSRKSSKTLPESAKTYRTFADQEYGEGQALISKEEQDEVLAVPGLRP